MKTKMIIFTLLGVFLLSCSRNPDEQVQVIHVNVNSNQHAALTDRIDIREIISLDHTHPLGEVRKALAFEGRYYLLDKSSDEIFGFDQDGHFLFRLSDKGKGPDEYIFIQNFYLDPLDHQIRILSGDGKVLSYTFSGEQAASPVDSCGFGSPMDAVQLNDGAVAVYGLGPSYNLFVQKKDAASGNYYMPFIGVRDMTFSDKAFASGKNEVLFCHGTNDSIYEIGTESSPVKAKYYIDFGANRIDPSMYLTNPDAVEKVYTQRTVATKLDDLNETPDFLLFSYLVFDPKKQTDVKKHFIIYEKGAKKVLNMTDDEGLLPVSDVVQGNLFLSLVLPVRILTTGHQTAVREKLANYMTSHQITEESNPLLVLWTLK